MSDPLAAAFGDRVRWHRSVAGLSQEKLADLAGRHRTFVGQIERGEKNPTLRTIVDLAAALEIDPAVLVQRMAPAS